MYRLRHRMTTTGSHLIAIVTALMAVGVLMVYSASAASTLPRSLLDCLRDPAMRQVLLAPVGLVVMLLAARIPYRRLRMRERLLKSPPTWLLATSILLLVLVLTPGVAPTINGAKRWLRLSVGGVGLSFQPSETAKLTLVIFLSAILSWPRHNIRRFWRGLLPLVMVIGLVCGLIGKEDLGTMVLVAAVAGSLLLAGGAKIWHLALFVAPAIAGIVGLIVIEPFRMRRILAFLNIYGDPEGIGYHPIQSLISLTGGGWWGRGLGSGIQKYGYLPEAKSDFIFAVVCEELGVLGGVIVIGLFMLLLWQASTVVARTRDAFGRLLALGIALTFGLQAAINVAVVTVSVPTKGISLPFVSAGGSGIIFASLAAGLLAGVARRREILVDSGWIEEPDEEREAEGLALEGSA